MRELSRRDALAGATALGTVVLAGCVSDDGDDDSDTTGNGGAGNGDDNDAGNGDDNGANEELELLDTAFESAEGTCSSPTGDSASLEIEGTTLRIEGTSPAPNPCHKCVLDSATFENDSLSLVISVESTLEGEEACIECNGEVSYEATCEFSEEIDATAFDTVTVEHEEGETHTLVETGEVVEQSGTEDSDDGSGDEETASVLGYQIQSADHDSDTRSNDVGDGDMEYSYSDGTVTIKGWIITPTPCYDPVIYDVSFEDGELAVDMSARNTAEDEVCTEVISKLTYTAEVTLAPGTELADVSVTHSETRSMERLD